MAGILDRLKQGPPRPLHLEPARPLLSRRALRPISHWGKNLGKWDKPNRLWNQLFTRL